jgi:REP-associated tyrosine transposase
MARALRMANGGVVHHVFNRGSRRGDLFERPYEFGAFERLLIDARERRPMRILGYCLMRNHWHLLLWPYHDKDLSRFMHWLTGTHALRWRKARSTIG